MISHETDSVDIRLLHIERKLDELKDRLGDSDVHAQQNRARHGASRTDRTFWGIFLIVLGSLWLADRMGWVNISAGWLWPSLLVGFGLYLILGGRQR